MLVRLVIILAVVAVAVGGAFWYWTTTPLYAIEQIKNGIKAHDVEKVTTYADLDSVSNGIVEAFVAEPMQKMLAPQSLGQTLVSGLVGLFKPRLASTVKRELINFVEAGSFAKEGAERGESTDQPGLISLSGMDKRFGFRKHAFRKVVYTRVEGKTAVMGLDMFNATYETDLILEVRLHDVGGHWRLIELTNLPEFIGKLMKLEVGHMSRPESDSREPEHAI